MIDVIFAIKFVHVLAAATMVGTWLCLAAFMWLAHRSKNTSVVALISQFVVTIEKTVMIPAILLSGAGLNKPSRRKLLSFCLMFLMLGGCLLLGACASSGSAPTHGGNAGTPAGPYVVTVTGSTNGIPPQTTSVSLTVQ